MQTLDFITPVADDPFIFGQIAAANSLSDVFAMGGSVINALNIVGFDGCHFSGEILAEILAGGADKVAECGGVIVGGHTIQTPETYYGLSVTGRVDPRKFWSNNAANEGDALILTKPLGTGVLSTALKADMLDARGIEAAVETMRRLNFAAVRAMEGVSVSAATDVTGFGFLGHLSEMLNERVNFEIFAREVPILSAAASAAALGIIPEGSYKNREFAEKFVDFSALRGENFSRAGDEILAANGLKGENFSGVKARNVDAESDTNGSARNDVVKFNGDEILLFDAQTSGGLIIAVNQKDALFALNRLKDAGYENSAIVGVATRFETKSPQEARIKVR